MPTTTAVRLLSRHYDAAHHDAILLVRRAGGEALAGCWELPGGKVDADEMDHPDGLMVTLAREVREETGLRLVGPGIHQHRATYQSPSNKTIDAHVISCISIGSVTLSAEHDDFVFWQSGQPLPTPMTDSTQEAFSALGC